MHTVDGTKNYRNHRHITLRQAHALCIGEVDNFVDPDNKAFLGAAWYGASRTASTKVTSNYHDGNIVANSANNSAGIMIAA